MIKYARQLILTSLMFCFVLISPDSKAQELPKADNSVHDRMYSLMQKSDKVSLPKELADHITRINEDKPHKAKLIYSQTSMLKVLYNKALTKDDIRFFGNQLLKNHSKTMTPIHADIRKILNKL
jgi:hypothetical protein